jgi:hypothetical protein
MSKVVAAPRDWLGRRLDLRECHRDPSCFTHRDPLAPCSCRSLFLRWDFLIDWVLCGVLVGSVLLVTMLIASTFS